MELIHKKLPRASTKAIQLLDYCFLRPYLSISEVAGFLGVTDPTARALVAKMESIGALEEITRRNWGRIFAYREYINILREGTELIPPGKPRSTAEKSRSR